jgi:protein-S-isoprenylcysteine O-methyltransferase Ste14
MNIKGMDALRKHVPELQTSNGLQLAFAGFLGVFIITSLFFIVVDRQFSEWMPDGEIVILALGFLILSRFFTQKTKYKQKFGNLAFRNAFTRFCIPGLGIIIASIGHLGYMFGVQIPDLWWRPILIGLGWVFVLSGAVLWYRSVRLFGVDNLSMLYVYYPDESRMSEASIYQMLRHPIYAAALDLGIGLSLIHANWYSMLVAVILPIFFAGWVRLIEEKELLERFPGYADYRKRVPPFWPKPNNFLGFFKFLILGG